MKKLGCCLFVVLIVTSCNLFKTPERIVEEKFRATMVQDGSITYENFFSQLAGINGTVDYSVFSPQGESNSNVKAVEVNIDKQNEAAKYKTVKMQYKYNTETGFIKLWTIDINGVAMSVYKGAMALELMMLESAVK